MGPATFVVTMIIGVCLVVGALVLGSSRCRRAAAETDTCPSCDKRNPSRAKFCAQCGHELSDT